MEMNKIYNEDCIEGMKKLKDNCIDFVLTDPPFNVGIDYGESANDLVDDDKYSNWCYEWIKQIERVLKDGSYGVIFSGDKKLFYIMKSIYKTKLIFHHFLKWYKPTGQRGLSGTVFFNRTELAFIVSKGKPNIKKIKRKILYSDTLIYNNTKPNDKFNAVEHDTRRPIPLYRQIIEGFGGEVILDCFMGTGTTAIACKQLGKKYIGFEINSEYCKIIEKNLSQEILTNNDTSQSKLKEPIKQKVAQDRN